MNEKQGDNKPFEVERGDTPEQPQRKKGVVLDDLLKEGTLSSPYVLDNISLTTAEAVQIEKRIKTSNKTLAELMDWAASAFNDDTSEHKPTLQEILPMLEKDAAGGSPTLTVVGVIDYFRQQQELRSETAKRRAARKQFFSKYVGGSVEYLRENVGIAVKTAFVIGGMVAAVYFFGGVISGINRNLKESEEKSKRELVVQEKAYLDVKLQYQTFSNQAPKLDSLRSILGEEINLLVKMDKLRNRDADDRSDYKIEDRNKHINEFSNYLVAHHISPEEAIGVVRYLIEHAKENNIGEVLEATQTYLGRIQANHIPYEAAMNYLKTTGTNESMKPDEFVDAASKMFTDDIERYKTADQHLRDQLVQKEHDLKQKEDGLGAKEKALNKLEKTLNEQWKKLEEKK